jgi:FKBP-type peptidyl-prolyl cis-trans isomerase FklB
VHAQSKKPVATKPITARPVLKNLLDSFSYAIGYNVAMSMKGQNMNKVNAVLMQRAVEDAFKGRQPLLTAQEIGMCMQKQVEVFTQEVAGPEIAKGREYLALNQKRKEVVTLPDGLQYEILKKSDHPTVSPKMIDTVVVNYIGNLIDGKEFDNSYKVGEPVVFPVNGVISGWIQILLLMTPGDKWRVFIPTEMAYNLKPRDPKLIPPGAALIFEISLEAIKPAQ